MSQRTTLQVLAALIVLCLSYAPTSFAAQGASSFDTIRISQPGENEAGTYWWIKYFQCMVEETKGGADWATAGEACEALQPTDPPIPGDDPEVPEVPTRMSSALR